MIPNSSVLAQDLDEVTISGRVADQNGAIIPGATVTAILITNNQERTAIADAEGRYRLIELQPGTYDLRATAANFGVREQKGLVTISGQNVQMDFTLAPAGVNETTVVVDEETASPVDTTRTVVGGTVTQREIEELPNTDRSPLNLIFTLGNVAEEPLSTRDVAEDRSVAGVNQARAPLEAGIFSLSGGAAYSNNITIDGLDNNDDRLAQERFQPSVDAIAEVQVITNQFSAEYGRASGGRVNIRTRAGTNKFRGRAFFYFRDEQLNANTYNNNRRGLSRLPFTEVNPGGTFSGPIPFGYFKNKTFFFSSYEFNNFDNTTRIDTVVPVGQNPLLALPSPTGAPRNENIPNNPAQIAPYITSVKTPSRTHTFTQRIDHNFTDNHNVTFNYQLGRRRNFRQYLETTRIIDDVLQGTIRNTDAFYITDNYVFSPKLVNQFRFQYSRFKPDFGTANPNDPVALITIRDTATQAENRSGTLTAGNSTANFASTRQESRHQFQDNLTYVTGPHSLKFGADVQVIESVNNNLGDATGTFNFDSVSDFLSNRVLRFRRNFGLTSALKNTYYGVYIQDEWRARSNLTVSLGLRYENEIIIDDNNNFGPRAAVAYSPFKTGKGVMRVGGGI
ncbi:MAG TPA: carboxypeptidase regulatory-like domain-containing protein, partial [Pyrinomonadaceae bacterium]|nr:carboxypeptidase regulatory-like domain-containing protein [Pyrinomonadaceae bacterium]